MPTRKTPRRAILPDRKDCPLAAATVVAPNPTKVHATPREHAQTQPLADCNFFRWTLTAGNADTHATGLPGIVEAAVAGRRSQAEPSTPGVTTASVSISAISTAGVVTFSASGSSTFDLLVWAK